MCHAVETEVQLRPLLAKATVVVIGPGLGQRPWGQRLLMEVLQTDLPLIVDADALNLIAQEPVTRDNWVMTPHPGEAARLLQSTSAVIQSDRFTAVHQIAERYQAVAVLKGAGSVIAAPGESVVLCDKGNPGMASGGMGDVLSGVMGSLIAQGSGLFDASQTGVYVHALAADNAAKKGGERGLLASDVINELRGVINGRG
jgi:NAD(P)H-hydrate epimerase